MGSCFGGRVNSKVFLKVRERLQNTDFKFLPACRTRLRPGALTSALIIVGMYLRAGVFSFGLLLVSRMLGLARESAQAAAFGTSGLGDVVIVMFTLPDLLVGILVSGALAYVLLPAWAQQTRQALAAGQQKIAWWLAGFGLVLGAAVWLNRHTLVRLLAPGLSPDMAAISAASLGWSAAALPIAMLAALWATRLQHERDFVGMYTGNLVVNVLLVAGLVAVALQTGQFGLDVTQPITLLGVCLMLAMAARLAWLAWRLPARQPAQQVVETVALPTARLWVWAALSSALVLLMPLAARSMVSQSGEGALASFNYAWKLVELPLLLAVQLVASLAFPALASTPPQSPERLQAMQLAFTLAWALACAAAAVVATFSLPLSRVLFGWGSMTPSGLEAIARLSAMGVWSLLPQALIAVLLTVMAITARMHVAVAAYAVALAAFVVFGLTGLAAAQGEGVMWALNTALALVAAALLVTERKHIAGALAFAPILTSLLACVLLVLLKPLWSNASLLTAGVLACVYALLVLASAAASSAPLRRLVSLKLAQRQH
jgi:putative peptidoglycan lipid II flippase